MSAERTDMHRLQELVRLHRLGHGSRTVARLLAMSPNTERRYREILQRAELLSGDATALPELWLLQEAVRAAMPPCPPSPSSLEPFREAITDLYRAGKSPKAIHDALRLLHPELTQKRSAIKRLRARLICRHLLGSRTWSWAGAWLLGGLALLSEGCTEWVVMAAQDVPRTQTTWEQSRVSYTTGTVIELRNGRVQYPMLHGEVAELQDADIPNPLRSVDVGIPTAIDLRRVTKVEVMQPAPGRTGLLVTGIVLGGTGIITGFVLLGVLFSRGGALGSVY